MKIAVPVIAAFLFSMMVGAFMTWAAWQRSADGDMHDATGIYFGFVLGVFGMSSAMVMGIMSPFLIGWLLLESRRDQRKSL